MKLRSIILLSVISFAGLSSCKSQKEIVKKTTLEHTAVANTTGVPYFKAVGTEPFWSIEISEKEVKFSELGNEKGIIFPNDNNDILYENMKLTYTNKTHMLTIDIKPGECSDGMSEQRYSYKANVSLIDADAGEVKKYYGCGQYFADSKLNSKWMLKTLRGEEISEKNSQNSLYIEFLSEKNMFTAFAGCNQINGVMKSNTENRLQLLDIASTKMLCEPGNKEQDFINVLAKVGAYKFDGDILILTDPTYVPIATFRKN